MANKSTPKKGEASGVTFTGAFWIAPDGRKFNNRLKAEQYVIESKVDSKSEPLNKN